MIWQSLSNTYFTHLKNLRVLTRYTHKKNQLSQTSTYTLHTNMFQWNYSVHQCYWETKFHSVMLFKKWSPNSATKCDTNHDTSTVRTLRCATCKLLFRKPRLSVDLASLCIHNFSWATCRYICTATIGFGWASFAIVCWVVSCLLVGLFFWMYHS